MTDTVNIKGTFSVKHRANNGLDRVADHIEKNRIARIPVVGIVEFHKLVETVDGSVLTVSLEAVEPLMGSDGGDPGGRGAQALALLDEARKAAGKPSAAESLFDGRDAGGVELPGQTQIDEVFDPDGRKSGEEIVAELDEKRAAKRPPRPAPAARGGGPEFSGGAA